MIRKHWLLFLACVALGTMLPSRSPRPEEHIGLQRLEKALFTVFDLLCINTRLDKAVMRDHALEIFGNNARGLEKQFLKNLSPTNEIGFDIHIDGVRVIVIMGRRDTGSRKMQPYCSAAIEKISFEQITAFIESNFKVKPFKKLVGGVGQIVYYEFESLPIGYERDILISGHAIAGAAMITLQRF